MSLAFGGIVVPGMHVKHLLLRDVRLGIKAKIFGLGLPAGRGLGLDTQALALALALS